ncbi:TPA: restriction endonuclease subunit S [Photobacterium damselae]
MSELPKGWVECELKQLISISSGKSLTQKKMIAGNIPVFGGNGITGWHNESNISKKIIVIGRVGFYCGSVYITPENAWVTDNAFITSFSEDHIDIHYLYWLLKFTDLRQNDSSSAQPVISGQKVYPIKVKLPPLNEQKRIVEKLDEVLAQVDTIKARLDGIPAILKRFRQSVLAAAVSGKLTEEWRGESSTNWKQMVFDEVVLASGNGLSKRKGVEGKEITVLRLADFKNAQRIYGNERKIILTDKEREKYLLSSGDLLAIRVNGSIELAGKFIRYSEDDKAEAFCDHFIRFSLDTSIIIPDFMVYIANEGEGRYYLQNSLSTSAGQNTINQKSIKALKINLPELNEQKEIVRLVDQYFAFADTIEAQVKKAQTRVDNLTQSILAKAFRGELVPQDPNDEPADKLLERIAVARKEAEALAKAAKKAQTAKKRTVKKESAQES